jgi:hypothetical protein
MEDFKDLEKLGKSKTQIANYSSIIKETSRHVDNAHAMGNAIENRMKF